ncbi:MAG: hypothetical protein K6E13_05730 [Lachnospiraceae bacterium]|nr:hypothetical protein [Lachnospiraceae bacterium]
MTEALSKKMTSLGLVRERIIKLVFESKREDQPVLISEADTKKFLLSGSWDKIRNSSLIFEYRDAFPEDILTKIKEVAISSRESKSEKEIIIVAVFNEEKYHIPMNIIFRKKDNKTDDVSWSSFTSIEGDEKIEYATCVIWDKIAENIVDIMKNLEFIRDLESYDSLMDLLLKESIDGRHIKQLLEERFNESGIDKKKNRLDTIAGYADYPYMKKRWNTYLKGAGRKTPEWKNVVTTFNSFVGPIVDAIENDSVFFSDWMPELGRYLD